MYKVILIVVAAYCWFIGGITVLMSINGTTPMLISGLIHIGVAITATLMARRAGRPTNT